MSKPRTQKEKLESDIARRQAEAQALVKRQREGVATSAKKCLRTPDGDLLMQYLKAQTVHYIRGPETSPEAMMYYEGQRSVIGMIEELLNMQIGGDA